MPDADAERFLRHLSSGPAAIVDRRDAGAVCVILDRARSGTNCAPIELAGCRGDALDAPLAQDLIAAIARQARGLGLSGVDLMIGNPWAPHRRVLEAAGFALAYGDLDMRCAVTDWGRDAPLPDGLGWRDLEPALVDDFLRVYRAAFVYLPGVYFPDEAEQRRVLATRRGAVRVLSDGARVLAALRFAPDDAFLHSIVRDPAVKGRGFGRLVLDEARRCLPGRALTLNVVSSNRTAVELYRRHGFVVTADRDVLSKRLAE